MFSRFGGLNRAAAAVAAAAVGVVSIFVLVLSPLDPSLSFSLLFTTTAFFQLATSAIETDYRLFSLPHSSSS